MSLIIGPDGAPIRAQKELEEPDVQLPPPDAAPEDRYALSDDRVAELLEHEHVLVRQYAIEQVAHRDWSDPSALVARIADEPEIAAQAARALEALKYEPAAEAIERRFTDASGELAGTLASALGTLAPDRLFAAVKGRGRLDDEAFAGSVTALAITGDEDGRSFIDRSLTRANVVSPERRSASYSAALLSGDGRLVGRVLSQAVAESEREAPPEGASYPARAALAALAGGPPDYARTEAHEELWRATRETLEMEAPAFLSDEDWSVLQDALRERDAGRVLELLQPIAELDPKPLEGDDADDLGTMPARRKGLLAELIRQRAAIARVGPEAAALFVAVAARAAAISTFGHEGDANSPGVKAVVDALEGAVTAEDLVDGPVEPLAKLLRGKTERDIRTLLVGLVRSRFRRAGTIRRIARALLEAGHGPALYAAAAESPDPRVHGAVVRAALARRADAEAAVVAVLSQRPVEPDPARFALLIAEQLRTERCALAIGRAFFGLRAVDRTMLAQAVLRCGDLRLLPLVESRAYADEPEEATWVVLGLVSGEPVEGRFGDAVDRVMGEGEPTPPLQVPLQCAACGETLVYSFEHAYVDPQSKEQHGDPAFSGSVKCKACGAEHRLEPTEETTRILTAHMMQFISDMQSGRPQRPVVTPARTTVNGKEMGMAEAFRTLTREVETSPDAVRPHLHRARIGLLLRRPTTVEDIGRVLELDPTSVEAKALEAQLMVRNDQTQAAMDRCAELVRQLSGNDEPRLYDVGTAAELREGLEDLMLELSEEGATAPSDINLIDAEFRREKRAIEARRQMEQADAQG